jgi:hypothetical protein
VAGLDQLGPEGAHGGVLFHRIAFRHDDGGGDAHLVGADGDALAVIASGGADHAFEPGLRMLQPIHVDQAAAHLEGADRRVVLVLHPDVAARPPR